MNANIAAAGKKKAMSTSDAGIRISVVGEGGVNALAARIVFDIGAARFVARCNAGPSD